MPAIDHQQTNAATHATVLIVGAGPVGLASAVACRALGLDVRVLEADAEDAERPGSRALFLHRETLGLLQHSDPELATAIADYGVVWQRRETWHGGRCVYHKAYAAALRDNLPPFVSLRQPDTERILRQACDRWGIPISWQWPVDAIASTSDGCIVRSGSKRLTGDYVLATDGARSRLRRELGIELEGTRSQGFHVVVDIQDDPARPRDNVRTLHYAHPAVGGRTVLLVPFRGGFQVDLQCREGDDPEVFANQQAAATWLQQVLGVDVSQRIMWISRYQFQHRVARQFIDDQRRVLLMGDAAHLFPPFGARGLNSGIADADAAARAIALGVAAIGEPRRRAAIEAFDAERRRAARNNSQAAAMALSHLRPVTRIMRVRQRAAAALSAVIPALGYWLDSAPYGPRSVHADGRRY